jgi:hypothetical protein
VNLAGFGDSFTDWLFQSATHAKQAASAFQLAAAESWKHGSGWVAVYCMRYLGSGRRLLAPDELLGVLIPDSGISAIAIPTADLFSLVAHGTAVAPATSVQILPSLSMAENTARGVLKERIQQRGVQSKTSPGLSLWTLARIC